MIPVDSPMTLQQAAWEFNVATKWIWNRIIAKQLPSEKKKYSGRAGRYFVKREDLERLIEQRRGLRE